MRSKCAAEAGAGVSKREGKTTSEASLGSALSGTVTILPADYKAQQFYPLVLLPPPPPARLAFLPSRALVSSLLIFSPQSSSEQKVHSLPLQTHSHLCANEPQTAGEAAERSLALPPPPPQADGVRGRPASSSPLSGLMGSLCPGSFVPQPLHPCWPLTHVHRPFPVYLTNPASSFPLPPALAHYSRCQQRAPSPAVTSELPRPLLPSDLRLPTSGGICFLSG